MACKVRIEKLRSRKMYAKTRLKPRPQKVCPENHRQSASAKIGSRSENVDRSRRPNWNNPSRGIGYVIGGGAEIIDLVQFLIDWRKKKKKNLPPVRRTGYLIGSVAGMADGFRAIKMVRDIEKRTTKRRQQI